MARPISEEARFADAELRAMQAGGLCCLDGTPHAGRCWSCGHREDVKPGWKAKVANGQNARTPPGGA